MDELVHGWKSAARLAGVSERYVRQLAAERGLVVGKRDDGAVAIRRADLKGLAEELRHGSLVVTKDGDAAGTEFADTSDAIDASGGEKEATAQTSPTLSSYDEAGEVAALVFTDLRAGRGLVEIVADRKIAPEVVRACHAQWCELQAIDDVQDPRVHERLELLEEAVARDAATLGGVDVRLQAAVGQLAALAQTVAARLRVIERRDRADGSAVLSSVQRLAALEGRMNTLPGTPMPTGHVCRMCGGPVVALTCCGSCGVGRATPG